LVSELELNRQLSYLFSSYLDAEIRDEIQELQSIQQGIANWRPSGATSNSNLVACPTLVQDYKYSVLFLLSKIKPNELTQISTYEK